MGEISVAVVTAAAVSCNDHHACLLRDGNRRSVRADTTGRNVSHIVFVLFLSAAATAFALLEIQVEGAAGWAAGLPTWRRDNRWTRALLGGRTLTGYHLYCHIFVLTAVHLPFGLGLANWTPSGEARAVAFLILFWILEDFLWFVLNPRYGVRGFTKERAAWHATAWWWIMPREYWIFLPVSAALYLWSS
jgi:hypothetical protein